MLRIKDINKKIRDNVCLFVELTLGLDFNKLLKITKIAGLIGVGIISGVVLTSLFTVSNGEYDKLNKEYIQLENNYENLESKYDDKSDKYTKLLSENNILKEKTSEYISLNEEEKEVIDTKIQEVKQATADQLAKEKEQKEAEEKAKKESEEEARRKEEEEEKARKEAEEQAKIEAEEQARQEQAKSTEQSNVISTAKQYINYMAFSRSGLIKQLEYEGYSTEAATYAVDNISVDWNEQCAKSAKQYMEFMSFSRQGLYDQLEYEGFTSEQIEYGLSAVGY